jgi:hypothetical protein
MLIFGQAISNFVSIQFYYIMFEINYIFVKIFGIILYLYVFVGLYIGTYDISVAEFLKVIPKIFY